MLLTPKTKETKQEKKEKSKRDNAGSRKKFRKKPTLSLIFLES